MFIYVSQLFHSFFSSFNDLLIIFSYLLVSLLPFLPSSSPCPLSPKALLGTKWCTVCLCVCGRYFTVVFVPPCGEKMHKSLFHYLFPMFTLPRCSYSWAIQQFDPSPWTSDLTSLHPYNLQTLFWCKSFIHSVCPVRPIYDIYYNYHSYCISLLSGVK